MSALTFCAANGLNEARRIGTDEFGTTLPTSFARASVSRLDDGFSDVFENALPGLHQHGFRSFIPVAGSGQKKRVAKKLGELRKTQWTKPQIKDWLKSGQELARTRLTLRA